jgi:uncharacterized protein YjiK
MVVALLATAACQSTAPQTPWNARKYELLTWQAVDPGFGQDYALEASGLTTSGRYFYVVAEKYATLLQIDPEQDYRVVSVPLDVPSGSEMEGVTWAAGTLYICDEAHAAVYAVEIDEQAIASGGSTEPLVIRRLPVLGLSTVGGKIGYEGVAVDLDHNLLYLLLERSGAEVGVCVATIFPLEIEERGLRAEKTPLVIPLEDCDWRLSGLHLVNGKLLGIQSRYPGELYQLLEIDPLSGISRLLLDITEMGRGLRDHGFGNNLEGIAVTASGDLFMVGDNADIESAASSRPPKTHEKTVFLRLPATAPR